MIPGEDKMDKIDERRYRRREKKKRDGEDRKRSIGSRNNKTHLAPFT